MPAIIINPTCVADRSKGKIITKDVTRGVKDMKLEGTQSKPQSMSYRRVTYGGIDGTYYTATTTRRAGSDGVCSFHLCPGLIILFLLVVTVCGLLNRGCWRTASKLIAQLVKQLTESPEESRIRYNIYFISHRFLRVFLEYLKYL